MTITELSGRVGMTVRNIRAYQSKGLLFPPEIRGRVAHYTGAHEARLQLIASLQREGFTLAAVRRLVDSPATYAAIVAERRRRFREGSSDISTTVPIPEDRIHKLLPELPDDLTETGLAWRDDEGRLVSHTVLVAVGRTLAGYGLPLELLMKLQLEAARCARPLAQSVREALGATHDDEARAHDVTEVAMHLSATAFEIAFLDAATAPGTAEP